MIPIPAFYILRTAREILESGEVTQENSITFPVILSTGPRSKRLENTKNISAELHTMFTVDGKEWLIEIDGNQLILGDFPGVYMPVN